MSIINKFKRERIAIRKTDEALYSLVAQEMESGVRYNGLWIKALEQANGDPTQQIAQYIKLRVQSLKDDLSIASSRQNPGTRISRSYDVEDLITMIKNDSDVQEIKAFFSHMDYDDLVRLVNTPDALDEYPIHVAINKTNLEVARWIIDCGAELSVENYWGKTPMDMALVKGDKNFLDLLSC